MSMTYILGYNFMFGFILYISLNFYIVQKSWTFMYILPDFHLL